jgi:pre-mRNA-splicing factor ISY1
MARNEEKSHSMLNKWVDAKKKDGLSARRPHLASECESLRECEKWRREVLQEVGRKVSQIQNGKLQSCITCS